MSGASTAERVLVLGVGNPILGDDGVGWCVALAVGEHLAGAAGQAAETVEVDCVALGGLSLMERLVGYDRAILVDAFHGSGDPPGTVRARTLEEVPGREASHLDAAHDVPLRVALAAGRALGATLPAAITVVSVEAEQVDTFDEGLTPDVAAAVPGAVRLVERLAAGQG
jgi:hydrogenase maturation protease